MDAPEPETFHDYEKKRRKSIINRELVLSAGHGHLDNFESCLQEGASLEFVDQDGNTCLHWAARGGNVEMAKHILKKAPRIISQENKDRETALEIAMKHKSPNLTKNIGYAIFSNALKLQKEFEILTQARKQEDESRSFVEATIDEDYTAAVSKGDFQAVIDMICSGTLPYPMKDRAILEFDFTNVKVTLAFDQKKITPSIRDLAAVDDSTQNKGIRRTAEFSQVEELFQLQNVVACLKSQKKALSDEMLFKLPQQYRKKLDEEEQGRARKFFANLLNEKQRTESKISSCLTALRGMKEKDIFTHQNVNIFIFFVETFAMQDTEPIVKVPDKEKDDLRKLKKLYFQNFFHGPVEIIGQIDDIRQFILHNDSRNVLTPQSFARFNKETKEIFDGSHGSGSPNGVKENWKGKVNELFDNITRFVENVHGKKVVPEDGRKSLKSFLYFNKKEKDALDDATDAKFLMVVRQFFKNVRKVASNMGSDESEVLELLSFDLMANIFPRLERDLPKYGPQRFKRFRNILVHDFQNVSTVSGKTQTVKEGLTFAIPELYKYFLAMELHKVVRSVKVEQQIKKTDEDLCKAIEKVDSMFPDNAKVILPINKGKESFGKSFEDPALDVRGDLTQSVSQYLRYMAPLFDVKPQTNLDDAVRPSEPRRRMEELPVHDRIELFEKLRQFDRVKSQKSGEGLRVQLELKSLLKGYPIDTNYFIHINVTRTLEMAVKEEDEASCVGLVKSTIENIRGLTSNKELAPFKINTEDLILLYEARLQRRREFSLSNIRLTRDYDFCDAHKHLIENVVNSLPVSETTAMEVGGVRKEIMISSVVLNFLKIFDLSYKQYQVKIPTIKLVFDDETVLDYLVSYDVKKKREHKEEDTSFVYKTIRSLQKLEYTAPYIARLVTVFKDNVIEEQDLLKLVITLTKHSYHHHLLNLVMKYPRAVTSFCKVMLNDDISDNTISAIFTSDSIIEQCLSTFVEDLKSLKTSTSGLPNVARSSAKKLVTNSHAVALDNMNKARFDIAEKILNVISPVEEEICGSTSAESKLNKAKLALLRGRNCQDRKEQENFYNNALQYLEEISPEYCAPKMLALSRQGYVLYLLKRFEDASRTQKLLYQEFLNYFLPTMPNPSFNEAYSRLRESRAYNTLLSSGSEYQKYLHISAIYKSMLYYEQRSKPLNDKETLKIVDGYRRLCWALEQEPERELTGLLPTWQRIARSYLTLAQYYEKRDPNLALAFQLRDLEVNTIIYAKQKEILGIHDTAVQKTMHVVESVLKHLARNTNF